MKRMDYRTGGKRSRSESTTPTQDEYSAFVAWLALSIQLSKNRKRLALASNPVISLSE